MEAEAALQARKAAESGRVERPTQNVAFGHMPEAIRHGMAKAAEAVVDRGIHNEFTKWVACEGHQKAIAVGESVEQDTQQSYTRYFEALGKTKSLAQWRAKALALEVPSEGCLAARSVSDVGRMLLLKWATAHA